MSTASARDAGPVSAILPSKLVRDLAHQAIVELFSDYGVSIFPGEPPKELERPILCSGVVGFTGPGLRGSSVLSLSQEPIVRSMPAAGSESDWLSELSNQLVGRIKNKMLAYGAVVYVTTPVVLRGSHLVPQARPELRPLLYYSQPGNILLSVELEMTHEFVLAPPEPAVEEGELLLF